MGDFRNLQSGDEVKCAGCSAYYLVSQAMLETLASSQRPRLAPSTRVVDKVAIELASLLVCPICGAEGAKRVGFSAFPLERDPAPRGDRMAGSAVAAEYIAVPPRFQVKCKSCNGFNGLHETCLHCGGTGFEPLAEE